MQKREGIQGPLKRWGGKEGTENFLINLKQNPRIKSGVGRTVPLSLDLRGELTTFSSGKLRQQLRLTESKNNTLKKTRFGGRRSLVYLMGKKKEKSQRRLQKTHAHSKKRVGRGFAFRAHPLLSCFSRRKKETLGTNEKVYPSRGRGLVGKIW